MEHTLHFLLADDTVVVVEHCLCCHRNDIHIIQSPASPAATGRNYSDHMNDTGLTANPRRRESIPRSPVSSSMPKSPDNMQKKQPLLSVRLPPLEDRRFQNLPDLQRSKLQRDGSTTGMELKAKLTQKSRQKSKSVKSSKRSNK